MLKDTCEAPGRGPPRLIDRVPLQVAVISAGCGRCSVVRVGAILSYFFNNLFLTIISYLSCAI